MTPVTSEPVDVRLRNSTTVTGNLSGRPIVFAHGFGCSQEMWRPVADQFEADYKVVVFDHVGSGRSDLGAYDRAKYDSLHGYAADLLEILEDLDLEDVVFVGHSVSAMIGVLASIEDPSRFGALVLVGPSARYVDDGEYRGGFTQRDIDALLDALDSNYLGWSENMAPAIMANRDQPALSDELAASFCSMNPEIAQHFARVTFLSDNRRDLPDVTIPSLILQCTDDVIAPLTVGEFVHASIPGSTMVVIEASGHCPNLSAPDLVAKEIRAFLQ
jgi:sigma-B regulation protein RsbQ